MSTGNFDAQLEAILTSSSSQNEKTTEATNLLRDALKEDASSLTPIDQLRSFAAHLLASPNVPMVTGRALMQHVVDILTAGSGYEPAMKDQEQEASISSREWSELGTRIFGGLDSGDDKEEKRESRQKVTKAILDAASHSASSSSLGASVTWCDEQLTTLKHLLAHLYEQDEEWNEAAKVLMGIPLETAGRNVSDEEKLKVYIHIVRLLLETGESGQAQTYFNRASLLIHNSTDKEVQLSYRLCQARLFDFNRRFNEAAGRYHELSFQQEIDEEERTYMLSAAVTCAILAPAGPQRSRILANLYRDDRTASSLPPHKANILRRMFLDHIIKMDQVREFEAELADHQKAKLALDRRYAIATEGEDPDVKGRKAAESILDRAIMEHNIQASAKLKPWHERRYDPTPSTAGTLTSMRPTTPFGMITIRMIEQGRLRAWMDQVDRLIFFENRGTNDDRNVEGTAGGLGVAKQEPPIEPTSAIEHWDERIKLTSNKVEDIYTTLRAKGLIETI